MAFALFDFERAFDEHRQPWRFLRPDSGTPEHVQQLLAVALEIGRLAGIHLDRAMIWVGAIMTAGYLALFFIQGPVWTFTGIAVAAGLALSPWLERRGRA